MVGVGQARAGVGVAADALGLLPDDLGEMTPHAEVAVAGLILAVHAFVVHHFAVVHAVGEQLSDVGIAVAHVLAVAANAIVTVNLLAVLQLAMLHMTHVLCS